MSPKGRSRPSGLDLVSSPSRAKSQAVPGRSPTSPIPSGNAFAVINNAQHSSTLPLSTSVTSSGKATHSQGKPSVSQGKPASPNENSRGTAWKYRQPVVTPASTHASRLAKIKSTPAQGALAAARRAESHGRLHKRSDSASAASGVTNEELSTLDAPQPPKYTYAIQSSTAPMPHREPVAVAAPVASFKGSSTTKTKTKVKPLLRRLKSQEEPSLDLSRSAAEHEGLGLHEDDYGPGYYTTSDMASISSGKRGQSHQRSTSGTSQFSTATTSSGNRQYVHPMRQTPRPYTPPIATPRMQPPLSPQWDEETDEQRMLREVRNESSYINPGRASPPIVMPVIYTHHISSSGLLNRSQSHLPGTPSSTHFPGTISPVDTLSPTSRRSSVDKMFNKRVRTASDPAMRQANIQAARAAFNEREARKERNAEKTERKTLERELRKRQTVKTKKQGSRFSLSGFREKDEVLAGREYSSYQPAFAVDEEKEDDEEGPTSAAGARKKKGLSKPKVPGWWMYFIIWFRTRLFKMRRTVTRKVQGKK